MVWISEHCLYCIDKAITQDVDKAITQDVNFAF